MTKIYAFYLPQFHRTPENDAWWGEGFTEWTTVKKAISLFEGHEQPRIPWRYYDLLEKETMVEQASLMKEYGIDGLCFYHYYFEKGKKILEKPAENLLRWKDINMPFCFYWANESWANTWSNIQDANVWTSQEQTSNLKEDIVSGEELLLKQEYGDISDWKKHFEYLLPFFKDKRYIKKDGRPVFIIYNPSDIHCLSCMKECWDVWMEEEGLPHIYFIGKQTYAEVLDGYLNHEPNATIREYANQRYNNAYGLGLTIDYDEFWQNSLSNDVIGQQYYYCGTVSFDNTPRHGKNGTVLLGATPQKFKKYFTNLLINASRINSDMVFLNAWNEWGEGMYLEPDLTQGTAYLEAVKDAKEFVATNKGLLCDLILNKSQKAESAEQKKVKQLIEKNERYQGYWKILRDWLYLNVDGKSVADYFVQHDICQIAIYGMGMLGTPLYKELIKHGINVLYGIDQDITKKNKFSLPIYTLEDDLPEVDIIVVTVDYVYEQIKSRLREKGEYRVISLKEVLHECDS